MKTLVLLAFALMQAARPEVAAAPTPPSSAIPLAALRGKVLVRTGKTVPRDLHLFPLAEGAGRVFVQPIHETGALALRIHFKLLASSTDPWRVMVGNGPRAWQHQGPSRPGSEDDDFWSDEIPSSDATVEIYTTRPGSSLKLTIDKISARFIPLRPQSITGRNDLAPIAGQDPWIVALGKSVALIRFSGDESVEYVCTGFLVSSNLVMTNQHCISSGAEARSAQVVFDFDSDSSPVATFRVAALERTDHDLDYSLLRLEKPVHRPALRLGRSAGFVREDLLMIEHPGGEPKQVSIKDCRLLQVEVAGRSSSSDCPPAGAVVLATDFAHECDTKPGSSGSPVFDWAAHEVIGLHHLGFCPGQPLFNKAVSIRFILDDLQARRPDLLTELSVTGSKPPAAAR